jgi:hypothetical protein
MDVTISRRCPMTEQICPYCGMFVVNVQEEITHMTNVHPGIVGERLFSAGLSWQEIEDILTSERSSEGTELYEYKKVNVSTEPKTTIEAAANRWAAMGWRTVAVMQVSAVDRRGGFADSILVERKKETI